MSVYYALSVLILALQYRCYNYLRSLLNCSTAGIGLGENSPGGIILFPYKCPCLRRGLGLFDPGLRFLFVHC